MVSPTSISRNELNDPRVAKSRGFDGGDAIGEGAIIVRRIHR